MKLISPTLFAMMVFMAVFTTLTTAPLLTALKIAGATRLDARSGDAGSAAAVGPGGEA